MRERRRLRNQALFRDVNERIREIGSVLDRDAGVADALEFFCECGDAECSQRLRLEVEDYLKVRERTDRFIVASGHADEELERVVERRDGYDVVELLRGVG